jgi:hypothetical protein
VNTNTSGGKLHCFRVLVQDDGAPCIPIWHRIGRPPSGQTAITVANMYSFKKCYILARASLQLLPFRYAAAVLYNSNNRMHWGGGLL